MACAVHTLQALPKPAAVSVNGVAIPRDAIAREVQHHPGVKAYCSVAVGGTSAGDPRAAAAAGAPPRDRARPAHRRQCRTTRDRRRGADPRSDRAGGRDAGARRGDLPALLRAEPTLASVRARSTKRRISSLPRAKTMREGYAQARRDAASVLAELKLRPERFGDSGAEPTPPARRLRRVEIWARSQPDRRHRNSSRRLTALTPGLDQPSAGRDALRPAHHSSRPQDRGSRAAVRARGRPHRRLSERKRHAPSDGAIHRAARVRRRDHRHHTRKRGSASGQLKRVLCCLVIFSLALTMSPSLTETILSLGDLSLLAALRERADADGLELGTLAALRGASATRRRPPMRSGSR